jgi:hypothetical protein
MKRGTSQDEPVCTGIRLELSDKSAISFRVHQDIDSWLTCNPDSLDDDPHLPQCTST